MNVKTIFTTGAICLGLIFATGLSAHGARHDDGGCSANATTMDQLNAARRATARFNSIQAAEMAGYTNINLPIPNMGDHWVNFDLVDNTFEADAPEALVYADLGNGRLQLVAVEYLAPYVAGDQEEQQVPSVPAPPAGFVGTCDRWSPFTPPGDTQPVFWTLHAWIWYENMSGTFAKFNPLVP